MLRILVADDHEAVRNGLVRLLRNMPEEILIGESADGNEALQMIQAEAWDVVLLDISLPGMKGTDVLKKLRQERPDLPVLMYSLYTDRFTIMQALKAGASGYLSKESVIRELSDAIEAVLAGRRYISQALVEAYNLDL